jgi:hypothetical protein
VAVARELRNRTRTEQHFARFVTRRRPGRGTYNVPEAIPLRDRIAQKLLESSLISQDQLARALESQQSGGGTLSYNLVKTGAISEMAFAEFMGQVYNVPAAGWHKRRR